jgi:Brp/Blh family beta-carotene 15,15'-monooxygenase
VAEGSAALLLGLWIGPEGTSQVLPVLHGLAPYWLVLLLLTAVDELTRRSGAALELLAVAALGTLAPAVIGFAIFFCAMHSARHVLRGVGLVGRMAPRAWLLGLGLPLVGTIALGALAWPRVGDASLDARLVRLLFTGLAALTVPHLAVVEPIRFAGWLLVPRRTLFPIGGATQGPGPHA